MSQQVSFTLTELEKLRSLYGLAWGYDDKTAAKLARAIEREQKPLKKPFDIDEVSFGPGDWLNS